MTSTIHFFDKHCDLATDGEWIDGIDYGMLNEDTVVLEDEDISIWDYSPHNM